MATSYNYYLVALSVVISTLASYAALDLAGRVTAAQGRLRLAWLAFWRPLQKRFPWQRMPKE